MIGLLKNAFNKVIGYGLILWQELEQVLCNVESTLNDPPLSYDVALPVLTPNSTMFLNTNILPDLQPHHIPDIDLWRRAKYLHQCKDGNKEKMVR